MEGRGRAGREEERRNKERKKRRKKRKERGLAISLIGKSGFSMETEVPVCVSTPAKRKIVNHFPGRRQDDCPGFDS